MIWESIKVFTDVRNKQKVYADDSYDKLNRSTTVILLLIAAAMIASNKMFNNQITCLDEPMKTIPVGMDYVNSLCLAKNTYTPVDFYGGNASDNTYQNISYYPWLFFIVCTFAIIFYLPYVIWKSFIRNNYYHHIPVDISGVVNLLNKNEVFKKDDFEKSLKLSSEYLDNCFSVNNFNDGIQDDDFHKSLLSNKQPKSYYDRRNKRTKIFYCPLIFKYLIVKVFYLAGSIGVFFLAAQFLQMKEPESFYKFGFDTVSKWIESSLSENNSKEYLNSKFLPRVIFCDIHVRADKKNNIHHLQYQCALPANIFNERVFILIWAWFIIMIFINFYSLCKWILKLIFRRTIIKNILQWPYKYEYEINRYIDSFVYNYLSTEGFLVLMLIKSNTQDWHCRMLIRNLWLFYVNRINETKHVESEDCNNNAKMFDLNIGNNNMMNSPKTVRVPMRRDINVELTNVNTTPNTFYNINKLKFLNENDSKNNYKSSNELKHSKDLI